MWYNFTQNWRGYSVVPTFNSSRRIEIKPMAYFQSTVFTYILMLELVVFEQFCLINPLHIMGMQPIWRTKQKKCSLLGIDICSHVKKNLIVLSSRWMHSHGRARGLLPPKISGLKSCFMLFIIMCQSDSLRVKHKLQYLNGTMQSN